MTRRLRPPAAVTVQCDADGRPACIRYGGRTRQITRVAAQWIVPAAWWTQSVEHPEGDPRHGERAYYRLVTDGLQACEVFLAQGAWYLERIID
jgi:hypothetical protein